MYLILAASDWPLFGPAPLQKSPSTTAVGEGQAPINAGASSQNSLITMDSSPDSPTEPSSSPGSPPTSGPFQAAPETPLEPLNTVLNPSSALSQPGPAQPGIPFNLPDSMPNLLDIMPAQLDGLLNQFNAIDNQLDLSPVSSSSDPFNLFNTLPNPTNTAFHWFDSTQFGGTTLDDANAIPNSVATALVNPIHAFGNGNPAPPPDISLQHNATAIIPLQEGKGRLPPVPDSNPSQLPTGQYKPATKPNIQSPLSTLAGITDEPNWMLKRRTLSYFRGTFKFGYLQNVIEHWYKLEGLLGFQDAVSIL